MTTRNLPVASQIVDASLAFATIWLDVREATIVTVTALDERVDSSLTAWSSAEFDVLIADEWGGPGVEFSTPKDITHAAPTLYDVNVAGVSWLAIRVDTAQSNVHVRFRAVAKDAQ